MATILPADTEAGDQPLFASGVADYAFLPSVPQQTGAITVPVKRCCGALLADEYCDCAGFAAGLAVAPELRWPS